MMGEDVWESPNEYVVSRLVVSHCDGCHVVPGRAPIQVMTICGPHGYVQLCSACMVLWAQSTAEHFAKKNT